MNKKSFIRWLILFITVSLVAINIVAVKQLFLEEDLLALLPNDEPVISDFKIIVGKFKALDAMYFDITSRSFDNTSDSNPSDDKRLEELHLDITETADMLNESLVGSDLFEVIYYQFNPEDMMVLFKQLSQHKACLLNKSDLLSFSEGLPPQEIENRLSEVRRMMIEPSGIFLKESISSDPLGLDSKLQAKFGLLNQEFSEAEIIDGRIWDRQERHILLIGITKEGSSDSNKNGVIIDKIDGIINRLNNDHPNVRVSYTGGHRASLDNATVIKSDVQRSLTGAMIGIALLGLLFFRHKSFIFLVYLPIVFGVAATTILLSLFSPALSAISLGCSVVLIGIVVDYGIHILYRVEIDADKCDAHSSVRSIALPLTIGACTTAGGLLCLVASTFPGQQQMGAFGAIGVLISAIYAGLALPWLVGSAKPKTGGFKISLAQCCQRLLGWREKYSVYFTILSVIIIVTALFGIKRLRFDGDPAKLNYLKAEHLDDQNLILDTWGEFSLTSVVVRGSTYQDALEKNDKLAGLLAQLQLDNVIEVYSTISAILPSRETQRSNRNDWIPFWSGPDGMRLRRDLDTKAAGLSFSKQAFSNFYKQIENPLDDDISIEMFQDTAFHKILTGRIVHSQDENLVMSTFRAAPGKYGQAVSFIKECMPNIVVTNSRKLVESITLLIREQMLKIAVLACLVVTICLFFFLKRIELVLWTLLPVVFSLVLTLGILGWAGVGINLFSCLFVVFIFGVGIDYSVFLVCSYLDAYRNNCSYIENTFGAVIICTLTTIGGFILLALAEHPALFSIGITGLTGILSSLLAAILIVPMFHSVIFPSGGRYGTFTIHKQLCSIPVFLIGFIRALTYVLVMRPIMRLRYYNQKQKQARYARSFIHNTSSLIIRSYIWSGVVKGEYINADKENFQKPGIIVSNHISSSDISIIQALPVDMVMMVKKWVWKLPIFGVLVRDAGYLLVDDVDPEVLFEKSKELLSEGVSVMTFPEGTRSRSGQIQRFHNGVFELAKRTGADVIPVLIVGSQDMMPLGSFWVNWSRPIARVFDRITQANYDYNTQARQFASDVRKLLERNKHESNKKAQSGNHFLKNIRDMYAYRGTMLEYYVSGKLGIDPIYKHLDDYMPDDGSILDVGCGCGLAGNILSKKSDLRQIVGIDLDEKKIHIARQTAIYNDNLNFDLRDVCDLEAFEADGILLIDVLHYWDKKKQKALISRICKFLNKGGKLLFRDACRTNSWKHQLTQWSEVFSTRIGQNPKGDGLNFADIDFYLTEFKRNGLVLEKKLDHLGKGSNITLLFSK